MPGTDAFAPSPDNDLTAISDRNDDLEGVRKKGKDSKDGASKRKRKSAPNVLDRHSSKPAPSPQPQEKQNSRSSKRKRVSEPARNAKDSHDDDEKLTGMNGAKNATANVAVNGHASPTDREQPVPPKSKKKSAHSKHKDGPVSEPKPRELKQKPTADLVSANTPPNDDADKKKSKRVQGHASDSNKGVTGFFTHEEVESMESFKLQFCNEHQLTGDKFNQMVQHSDRNKQIQFPCDPNIVTKQEFWRNIYNVLPDRDRRSVYRFMRRHFQASTQKPHQWSEEQDEELVSLVSQFGPKFAHIAKLLGRSDDDVVQRWKNRLQYRDTMRRGPWSVQEVKDLLRAVEEAHNSMARSGGQVGKDAYETDETLISWGVVSQKLKHCRSRQQCADKWRKIRRIVLTKRDSGHTGAVYDAERETKYRPSVVVSQYKSSEYVDSGGEDGNEEKDESDSESSGSNEGNEPDARGPKQRNKFTRLKQPQKEHAKSKSKTVVKKETSSDSESSDESSSEESDNDSAQKKDSKSKSKISHRENSSSGSTSSDEASSEESDDDSDKKGHAKPNETAGNEDTSSDSQSSDASSSEEDEDGSTQAKETESKGKTAESEDTSSESDSSDDETSEEKSDAGSHKKERGRSSKTDDKEDTSSDGSSDRSSSEDGKGSSAQTKGIKPKGKTTDREDTSSESDSSDDGSSSEDNDNGPSRKKQAKSKGKTADKEDTSPESDSSDDDSSEESEDDSSSSSSGEDTRPAISDAPSKGIKRKARSKSTPEATPTSKRRKAEGIKSEKASTQSSSSEESSSSSESSDDSDSSESSESEVETKPAKSKLNQSSSKSSIRKRSHQPSNPASRTGSDPTNTSSSSSRNSKRKMRPEAKGKPERLNKSKKSGSTKDIRIKKEADD